MLKNTLKMNNTLKYKLIKTYPGSPELGAIHNQDYGDWLGTYVYDACNNEFWEKVEEKNWVITGGKIHATGYSLITQVTRLPDYVKFEIGDKVYNPKCPAQKFTIEKFYLDCEDRHMLAGPGHVNVNKIEHCKKPLFVTEDGVEIFEGNEYWYVNNTFVVVKIDFADNNSNVFSENKKYFSSEKAAQHWINENKPKFSKKELMDIINLPGEDYTDGEILDKILELIESK